MGSSSGDRVIKVEVDVFTRSAKPEITGDIEVSSVAPGESLSAVLRLNFPEDDVPEKLAITCSGPIIPMEAVEVVPGSEILEHVLELVPETGAMGEYELRLDVRHGVFYSAILSDVKKKLSMLPQEVEIAGVTADRYRVLAGENIRLDITMRTGDTECEVEIRGNVLDSNDKKQHFLDKRTVAFSGDHTETYTLTLSEDEPYGVKGIEVFIRYSGVKKNRKFENVFSVTRERDISISEPVLEPSCIVPGESFTVKGEMSNTGLAAVRISTALKIRKEDEDILVLTLDELTLEPPKGRESVPYPFFYRVDNTKDLSTGSYEVMLEISGDLELKESMTLEVSSGNEIELIGATVERNNYSPDEPVHLVALFETGSRLIEGRFIARATLTNPAGECLAVLEQNLDLDAKAPDNKKGIVEWVFPPDGSLAPGPVNAVFEVFDDTVKKPLSVIGMPYMFRITGTHVLAVKFTNEYTPGDIKGKVPDKIKRKIGPYMYPGEAVIDGVTTGALTTLHLDNGTYLHLRDGSVIREPDTSELLNETVLRRTAENSGFDHHHTKEVRALMSGIQFLVESMISSSGEGSAVEPEKIRGNASQETSGNLVAKLLERNRRSLRKALVKLKGAKKRRFAKRCSSDAYVCENLARKMMKRSSLDPASFSYLFELLYTPGDALSKKTNRLSKNTLAALEKIERFDPDFEKSLGKNVEHLSVQLRAGTLSGELLRAMGSPDVKKKASNGHGSGKKENDAERTLKAVMGLFTSRSIMRVLEGLGRWEGNGKVSLRGSVEHLHDLHVAVHFLYMYLELLENGMRYQERRLAKSREWLLSFVKNYSKTLTRILAETVISIANYRKNIELRNDVALVRKKINYSISKPRVEGTEGAVIELPLGVRNDAGRAIPVDIMLKMPGADFKVHRPPARREGSVFYVEKLRITPGKSEITFGIEFPPSFTGMEREIRMYSYARRGNLIGRRNSAAFNGTDGGSGGETDDGISSVMEASSRIRKNEEDRETIRRLVDEIIREKAAGGTDRNGIKKTDRNCLLVSELAKALGLRKKVLLELIRRSDVLALNEVTKKGGFLKLRTLVTHELRFASTVEMLLSLADENGSILNDAAYHPAGAARVISVLAKMLAKLPYAKKMRALEAIFTPERPSGKDFRAHLEEQRPKDADRGRKDAEKMFGRKITPAIPLSGSRSVNSIEGAVKALLEMKAGDVKKVIMNDTLRPLFGDTMFGEMFASICGCTRAGALIQKTVSEDEIKLDLMGRLGRSPMEECIFRNITHPMLMNLHNQSKGQASKTLARLRAFDDAFTPPALANDLFTLPKSIRPLVITTLGEMGDIRAVPSLAKILESSVEKDDRFAALAALIAIGSDGALRSVDESIGVDEKLRERARELGYDAEGDVAEESDLVVME